MSNHSAIVLDSTWAEANITHALRCLYCGDNYVHIDVSRVETSLNNTDMAPIGTNGHWVSIPASCESYSHAWKLTLGFHKGKTFVGTVVDLEGEQQLEREQFEWSLPADYRPTLVG